MEIPVLNLPRVAQERVRPPREGIPQTRLERERIRRVADAYVAEAKAVPPLSVEELRRHAEKLIAQHGLDSRHLHYIAVILNSELWRETLAAVPFERRLLLLPKCLRVEEKCPAQFDEFGLLCKECGLCSIQDLQAEAERLGYAVLVAEGSALVMSIIQTGKIEAIVGVSCLSVLEKAFPYMEAAAIPGMAIPLLQDDCKNTTVDLDWVWDVIHLTSADKTRRMDLESLRRVVESWFAPQTLEEILGPASGQTEQIARDWLARSGKRWRPFLAACAYKALRPDPDAPIPEDVRRIAVAVECFHKASLVHDDIEDDDALRYGEKTVHAEHGVPVALNVGDLLLGEGYRMIAECSVAGDVKSRMLQAASSGHCTLALGQGAELCWARDPEPLSPAQVLEIFQRKTAPAFEVALRLGAACAGADEDLSDVLHRYSGALGVAYQIRDDLEDLAAGAESDDVASMRPSLPLALAYERTRGDNRALLEKVWRRQADAQGREQARELMRQLRVEDRCRALLHSYKEQAVRSLSDVENASLKGLLRRVIGKIFSIEIKGWCSEYQAGHARGGAALSADAG